MTIINSGINDLENNVNTMKFAKGITKIIEKMDDGSDI